MHSRLPVGWRSLAVVWLVGLALPAWAGQGGGGGEQSEPRLGMFRNTHYYVVLETEYADEAAISPVLDIWGGVLAHVSPRFKRAMDIEGTGRLRDGRVLNYAARKPDGIRYAFSRHPFGRGVGDCPLVPFRTVAIDPTQVPQGAVVRIDETVGMLLPDGTVHDGLWRADDVGGAIKKDRVDLFVGDGNRGDVLVAAGITHLKPLTLRLVQRPQEPSCVGQPPQ